MPIERQFESGSRQTESEVIESTDDLLEQKQKLFEAIEASVVELERSDLLSIAKRVFEHSVEDGLSLNRRLPLTPAELLSIVQSPEFIIKHREVATSVLVDFHQVARLFPDQTEPMAPSVVADQYLTDFEQSFKDDVVVESRNPKLDNLKSDIAKDIYRQVDDYYKPFLSAREFTVKEFHDPRTETERLVENNLIKAERLLQTMYYSGNIRHILTAVKSSESGPTFDDDLEYLVGRGDVVSRQEVETFSRVHHLDLKKLEPKLKRIEYVSVVYPVEKTIATQALAKELRQTVSKREGQIWLNPETDKYEVKFPEVEDDGLDGEAKTETGVMVIDISRYDNVSGLTEINGQVFFRARQGSKEFIVDEHGRKIGGEFDGVEDPVDIGGKLFFMASRGRDIFVIDERGEAIGGGFDQVPKMENIGDRLFFHATRQGKYFVVNESGQAIGGEFDRVGDPQNIGGRLFFKATKDSKIVMVNESGQIISSEFIGVGDPYDIGGRLFFHAQKQGKWFIVNEAGETISGGFDSIIDFRDIGGRMFFVARKQGKQFVINESSQTVGEFKFTGIPHDIGGRLFFSAQRQDKWFMTNESGEKIGGEFDHVYSPRDIGGRLFFNAQKQGKWFIVNEAGETIGGGFDSIINFRDIGGRMFFVARKQGKEFIINETGETIGGEFDTVDTPQDIGGRLFFKAGRGMEEFIVDESGQTISDRFENIYEITDIGNRLFFRAHKRGRGFIVNEDGQTFGGEFDGVSSFYNIGGKMFFKANKNFKEFIVNEAGEAIGGEFDGVSTPRDIGGKMFFRAELDDEFAIYNENGQVVDNGFNLVDEPYEVNGKLCIKGTKGADTLLWLYDINTNQKQELTRAEQAKLDLLNLVHQPELEGIEEYFTTQSKLKPERSNRYHELVRSGLEHSRAVAQTFTQMIKSMPELFWGTVASKRDRAEAVLAKQISSLILPAETYPRTKKAKSWHGFGGYSGFEVSGRTETVESASLEAYLNPEIDTEMIGGTEFDDKREVFSLRQECHELMSCGIFGKCRPESGKWEKSYFAVAEAVSEPISEATVTIPNVAKMSSLVRLPKPVSAKVIASRVKGLTKSGAEVPLAIETNSLGEVTAESKPGVEQIVYSIEVSDIPPPMVDISAEQHHNFRQNFIRYFGSDLSERITRLPDEANIFLQSIAKLSPKEQVAAIESQVRAWSYYDFDNREVRDLKLGKSLDEQLMISEIRIDELRAGRPDLADQLAGKQFAGVCADFANLTSAMLRQAGFLSGVVRGFKPEGTQATVKDSHGTAFVVWPDSQGNNQVFVVDGTPSGQDASGREIRPLPSQAEREQAIKELTDSVTKQAEAKLEEMMKIINSHDVMAIKNLENGQLEKVVNIILQRQVKESHLSVLRRVLEYYWYTPVHDLDIRRERDKNQLFRELIGAVGREKQRQQANPDAWSRSAGKDLLELFSQFVDRFAKAKHTSSQEQAFNLLEEIIDITASNLDEIEQKAAYAVINYLRAKKIASTHIE